MKISKNLPAYDCKLYSVKELVKSKKKVGAKIGESYANVHILPYFLYDEK